MNDELNTVINTLSERFGAEGAELLARWVKYTGAYTATTALGFLLCASDYYDEPLFIVATLFAVGATAFFGFVVYTVINAF